MIIESILGGSVIVLSTIGVCSAYRRLRRGLAAWAISPQIDQPPMKNTAGDPTPHFTVDLLRTVYEHQSRREDQLREHYERREDQLRKEQFQVLVQMAVSSGNDVRSGAAFFRPQEDVESKTEPEVVAIKGSVVSRRVRRLMPRLPWRST